MSAIVKLKERKMEEISEKLNRYELFQLAANVLNADHLDELYLKKEFLLENVDSNVLNSVFFREQANEIRKMFQNSASLIRNLENRPNDEKRELSFRSLYDENLHNVEHDSYIESVQVEMQRSFGKDRFNYDQLLNRLIRSIASYQNRIIGKYLVLLSTDNSVRLRSNRPQSFLSYAYEDRGLSLALFYYFLRNKAFLYVDWMWRGAVGNGRQLKYDLNNALCRSNQLLFLRTPNSELKIQGGNGCIRQWCAWEIGNFYAKGDCFGKFQNHCRKFITNFSGNGRNSIISSNNILLSTFSIMNKVENGIIV